MEEDKRIYKYVLKPDDIQMLQLSEGFKILSVINQNADIVLYVLVDTKKTKCIPVIIGIVGTGMPIPFDIDTFTFINTVSLQDGKLILHVFYKGLQEEFKWIQKQ